MRLTLRWRTSLALLAAFVVLPPLATRGMPGLFTDLRAFEIGTGVAFAAMALSLNLLMGYAGQISLGHGAFFGIGAFTSGLLTARGPQLPFVVGLVAAAIVGGIFALAIGLPALRLRGLYLAVATIGFAFMMQESLFRWQRVTGGSAGLEIPRPKAGAFVFRENGDYLAVALVILLVVWLLDQNVVRTKLGRAFQAIRSDEAVAQAYGVDVARYKILAFVLSGALAGIGGAVYGHLLGFVSSSSFTYDFSLAFVIMVVVGGLGSRAGVAVAAFFYAILPRLLRPLLGWELIVGGALLIDVMARHPGGLAEALKAARARRGEKRARAGRDAIEEGEVMPKLPDLPRPTGLPPGPEVLAGAPMLEVRDVSVRFGGLQALDRVSLTVPAGKIVGLIGPNGAGKTTLFNVISGLVRPQGGDVLFRGRDLGGLAAHGRARVGMGRTFQLIGLVKNRSVLENFLLAQHVVADYGVGAALGFTPKAGAVEEELRARAVQAIEALGFDQFVDTPVGNLSHGQQRLVELGCALVTAPELLLLDEPSAGMSPAAAENLAGRLREIRDDLGRTVLLIEHHIPLVLDVCDEIYVLNFGQLLAHGSTEEIARRPEVIAAYFGEAEGAA